MQLMYNDRDGLFELVHRHHSILLEHLSRNDPAVATHMTHHRVYSNGLLSRLGSVVCVDHDVGIEKAPHAS